MLAQNFKTSDELRIREEQKNALCKVLVLLETGKLRHHPIDNFHNVHDAPKFTGDFNMATFATNHDCGTAACIAGTAELISGVRFVGERRTDELEDLFYANDGAVDDITVITPEQAAMALRSYLTTGKARWDLAVA